MEICKVKGRFCYLFSFFFFFFFFLGKPSFFFLFFPLPPSLGDFRRTESPAGNRLSFAPVFFFSLFSVLQFLFHSFSRPGQQLFPSLSLPPLLSPSSTQPQKGNFFSPFPLSPVNTGPFQHRAFPPAPPFFPPPFFPPFGRVVHRRVLSAYAPRRAPFPPFSTTKPTIIPPLLSFFLFFPPRGCLRFPCREGTQVNRGNLFSPLFPFFFPRRNSSHNSLRACSVLVFGPFLSSFFSEGPWEIKVLPSPWRVPFGRGTGE